MSARSRILVVDDEPLICHIIKEVLDGADVLIAGSLEHARQIIASTPLDAALLDKNLPDGSGLTIAKELRERDPHLATIMITGYPSLESALEALAIGIDDYVTKPFNAAELELKVRNAVDRTRLRREAERLRESVRQSEELHRELIAATPDGVLFIDAASQKISMANAAAQALYGYSQSELVGMSVDTLLAEADATQPPPEMGVQKPAHRWHRSKAGAAIAVEVSVGFAELGGKDVTVWIVRDIRERLQLEQENRRTQRMQTLGRLAGGVAHDLNNLLCVLGCGVEALADLADSVTDRAKAELLRELTAELRYVCDAQGRLTRQLGILGAQNRSGADEIIAVDEVLDDLKKVLSRTIEANVSLVVSVAPQLPLVRIDRGELEQIIVNLAVNARDAMANGGALLISATRNEQGNRSFVELRVQDTGAGIPDDVMPHIFEPFFTTKQPGKGTGLGLATVARIVEKASGSVRAESTPGRGTTFIISLPESKGERRREARKTEVVRHGHGERILLVDDDEVVRRAATRVLAHAGYAVLHSSHASQALEVLGSNAGGVDLVLTDIVMPELSGTKLAERIATLKDAPKVVFMSGYQHQLTPDGRTLAKPFNSEALLTFVASQLKSA